MSQQINLLNPLLRKKRFSFTSAGAMLYAIGIAMALAAAVAVYENHRLRVIEAQARATAESLKKARALHESVTARRGMRKPDTALEAKILDLGSQLKARQEIVDALQGGSVGTTAGFSEYMRAFSRQRLDGVWLTGFDIAAGGAALTITGRALSADLVPEYLQRLNREVPMQGRQFASVSIHQPKVMPDPGLAQTKNLKLPLPPFLEFTLSSGDLRRLQ